MYKIALNTTKRMEKAKVAYYKARALGYSRLLEAMTAPIDMKLAREAEIATRAGDVAAENLLKTLIRTMGRKLTDFEVECEVELAIEAKLCLEEEEDGITAYYEGGDGHVG